MDSNPEDLLSPKQREVLAMLRATREPVIVAANTGARLVEKGFALPAGRPPGYGPIPRGYGSFRIK